MSGDIQLQISGKTDDGRTGIPLGMASSLLKGIGAVYPGTMMGPSSHYADLVLNVPEADFMNPADPESFEIPTKDSPETVAFLTSFTGGDLDYSPPRWLAEIMVHTTEQILASHEDCNYLELSFRETSRGGTWFKWIVCRPGRPSPHELRQKAEARVAELEAQLAALSPAPKGNQ